MPPGHGSAKSSSHKSSSTSSSHKSSSSSAHKHSTSSSKPSSSHSFHRPAPTSSSTPKSTFKPVLTGSSGIRPSPTRSPFTPVYIDRSASATRSSSISTSNSSISSSHPDPQPESHSSSRSGSASRSASRSSSRSASGSASRTGSNNATGYRRTDPISIPARQTPPPDPSRRSTRGHSGAYSMPAAAAATTAEHDSGNPSYTYFNPYSAQTGYVGVPKSMRDEDMRPRSHRSRQAKKLAPIPIPTGNGFVPPHIIAHQDRPPEMARSVEKKRVPPDWHP